MKKITTFLMAIIAVANLWAQTDNQSSSSKPKLPVGLQVNLDVEGNVAFVKGFDFSTTDAYVHADSYTAGGVGATAGVGARVGRFLYVGAAAGVQGEWGKTEIKNIEVETVIKDVKTISTNTSAWVVPVYGDVRLFLPTSFNCYPFAEVGVGGFFGLDGVMKYTEEAAQGQWKNVPEGGLYMIAGVGLEFKRLTVGLGYKLLRNDGINNNHGYIKVGVSLGRNVRLRQ